MTDRDLPPCPFCGKTPQRISSQTYACDGLVDGVDVHNSIAMRPAAWRARAGGTWPLELHYVEPVEALALLAAVEPGERFTLGAPCQAGAGAAKAAPADPPAPSGELRQSD